MDNLNTNEIRLDCKGNVIENPFLYGVNDTMKLLGHQYYTKANTEEFNAMQDILNAFEVSGSSTEHLVVTLIKKFYLFSFIDSFFKLGVIYGMRMERKRRNKRE